MADLFQGIITFLTDLFAALEEFLGSKSGSSFSDILASIRESIGA